MTGLDLAQEWAERQAHRELVKECEGDCMTCEHFEKCRKDWEYETME